MRLENAKAAIDIEHGCLAANLKLHLTIYDLKIQLY